MKVFINFAKSSRDESNNLENDDENDENESIEDDEDEFENEEMSKDNNQNQDSRDEETNSKPIQNLGKGLINSTSNETKIIQSNITIEISSNPLNSSNMPTFESIKNHLNSLKKSRHIRKTSSANSQDFRKSQKTRMSQKSKSSQSKKKDFHIHKTDDNIDARSSEEYGFKNLAYEIEYKNSENCDIQIQESSHDLTTSINEDGEYFSKC